MIGMMYLVLTAMLALNVSSEVLQGFSLVDKSLQSSIQSANVRMDALLGDFQSLYDLNPTKVKEWLDKAHVVEQQSDSLFDYIQNFKYQMIRLADGKDADPKALEIEAKDNLDVAGQYALVEGNGKVLKRKLEEYRQLLVDLSAGDTLKQSMYEMTFNVENPKDKTWEQAMFEMMPLSAAAIMVLNFIRLNVLPPRPRRSCR